VNKQRNINNRPQRPKNQPVSEGGTRTSVDVGDQPPRVRWLIVDGEDVAARVFGPNEVTTIVLSPANLVALATHTLAIDLGGSRVLALRVGRNV